MQAAFKECHGLQCGFCTPGMVHERASTSCSGIRTPTSRRSASRARGQPLPLHRLPEHRQGSGAGRRRHAEMRAMGANDLNSIGQSVRRKEDYRFLTGAGQYTDDVNPPHHTHVYFLRSPHAHAKIRKIDTAKAKGAPGVVAIYHRRGPGRRQRPALRLAHHRHRRAADEGAAASAARARQGPLRRRPRGDGDRRDARPGEGCRRTDRSRLRRSAGGRRSGRPRSRPARRRSTTRRRATSATPGRWATRRPSTPRSPRPRT